MKRVGIETKDNPSDKFCTVKLTRTGHEGWNPASCMMIMMMMMMIFVYLHTHCIHTNIHTRGNTCLNIYKHATYIHMYYIGKQSHARCWQSLWLYVPGRNYYSVFTNRVTDIMIFCTNCRTLALLPIGVQNVFNLI